MKVVIHEETSNANKTGSSLISVSVMYYFWV